MEESSRIGCSFAVDQSEAQVKTTAEYKAPLKECGNCSQTSTPLWRRYDGHDLCNACGIYFRVNGFHRPFLPNMRKLLSSARKMGLSCVNCGTTVTSMWRRTPEGESICNACGLYFRLNGVKRPVSMRKDWIRKRQRKTQQISGIMRLANQASVSSIMSSAVPNTDCAPSPPGTSAPFEPSSQSHCFPSASYSIACEQPVPEYKPMDYVQYYTADYGPTVFQSQMGMMHESVGEHELVQMVQPMAPCISSVPSISYMTTGLPNYPTAVGEDYMHSYGGIKAHH